MKKIALLLCLIVASCVGTKGDFVCPALSIVPDGGFLTKYEEGTDKVYYQAVISSGEGYCEQDERILKIYGEFDIDVKLEDEVLQNINVPIDYFISVLDESNKVLLKENYKANVKVNKIKNNTTIKFDEIILFELDKDISKYNILLSFQLTEKELKDNRDNFKY